MLVNKISPINNYNAQILKKTSAPSKETPQMQSALPVPAYAHYAHLNINPLNFTGGSSVDLGESIKNLDEYQQAHPDEKVYPPGVREAAQEIIDDGDAYKWTLIDIHKDVFGDINAIGDLDVLKARFSPLFDEVESAYDVEGRPDSLLERMKAGELQTFNPKNELSADLIRLLYAEGLSTTAIKKYTDNTDIWHVVHNKLHIPLLNPHYAHILKLSDKDYNERLMSAIVATKQDKAERAKQMGEPVFIPKRKKITPEETVNVSGELEKHFEANPTGIYNRSENQQRFYEEHPEIAAKLSDLVLVAWGEDKKSSLTAKMIKHFEKAGAKIKIQDLDPFEITPENAKILKSFWEQNRWAIGAFSQKLKNLRAKEIHERTPRTASEGYLFKTYPGGLVVDFINWKKQNGIFEHTLYNPFMNHDGSLAEGDRYNRASVLLSKFFKDNRNSKAMSETKKLTLQDLQNAVDNGEIKDPLGVSDKIDLLFRSISNKRYNEKTDLVEVHIKANEMEDFYQTIIAMLIKNGHKEGSKETLDFLYKRLDENYEAVKAEIAAQPEPVSVSKKYPFAPQGYTGDQVLIFKTIPQGFEDDFNRWKKMKGIVREDVLNPMALNGGTIHDPEATKETNRLTKAFCDEHDVLLDIFADCYYHTIMDLHNYISTKGGGTVIKDSIEHRITNSASTLFMLASTPRYCPDRGDECQYVGLSEARKVYRDIIKLLVENESREYLAIAGEKLDERYKLFKEKRGFNF